MNAPVEMLQKGSAEVIDAAPVRMVRPVASSAPRVSVIVPAYNVRPHLREAVESLLMQTWRDLEVLVVDDASSDGTLQALDDVDDPRLCLLRMERNVGVSRARNAGLARARGEFIALLDGDDVSLPHRIEKQLQVLEQRPEVGLVSCLQNSVSAAGELVRPGTDDWRLPDAALKPLMLFTNPLPVTCMVRRSVVPAHGYRPIYAEDYAFAADVVAAGHEVALLREPLVNYRLSPNGIMASRLERVADGAFATQQRLLLELGVPAEAIDPSLLRTAMHFGRQPAGTLTAAWLLRLRRFFELVLQTNQRTRRYEPALLANAAARVWDVVLLEATKTEGMRPGPHYLGQLWSFLLGRGRPGLRMRSLAHAVLNVQRGAVAKPDPYGRDGERT